MPGGSILEEPPVTEAPAPGVATPGPGTPAAGPPLRSGGNALLWIVAGVFLIVLAAWGTLIAIACRHPVTPVTIHTSGGATR